MISRREFIKSAGLYTALPSIVATSAGCFTDERHLLMARTLRSPLRTSADQAVLHQELVRCATLAANGHNAQPWRFELLPDQISIRPDLSRRTPVVDPDDHHLWASLGCATENLVLAAAALGKHAEVEVGPQRVKVALSPSMPVPSKLVDAIFHRQCTRAEYDGHSLPNDILNELVRTAAHGGVRVLVLTDRAKVAAVLEYVTAGNSAQLRDAAFVKELKSWIRFSDAQATATRDGLFARSSGNTTSPPWLGRLLFGALFREKPENDKYATHLRSSAGVAILVGERADPASWFEVGRAYQRFALAATALGVRNALVNQPIEVPTVRTQFASWLGLGAHLPDLVVRFGRGPQLPYSLRRPVAEVSG
jgi:nitroreductase